MLSDDQTHSPPYAAGWKDGLEAAITIIEARRDASMGDDLRQVIDMVVNVAVHSIRELMAVHDRSTPKAAE